MGEVAVCESLETVGKSADQRDSVWLSPTDGRSSLWSMARSRMSQNVHHRTLRGRLDRSRDMYDTDVKRIVVVAVTPPWNVCRFVGMCGDCAKTVTKLCQRLTSLTHQGAVEALATL